MNLTERRTLGILIGLLLIMVVYRYASLPTSNDISLLTNNWIDAVTVKKCPESAASLFCPEVSREDIDRYFGFAKLPNARVLSRQYSISRSSDVYINTAHITWMWDGLKEPVVARMTFVFRGSCILKIVGGV